MATRTILTQFCLLVKVVAVAGNATGLSGGRPAHGQVEAKRSPRTIEDVRGHVAELAVHAERQRSHIPSTGIASISRSTPDT